MRDSKVLLVEDNPDDELLILRAFKKNCITKNVIVARDGLEALDFIFSRGRYSGRDTNILPRVILLDLKLPGLDGFQVLKQLRENEKTRLLPVVILTSSRELKDIAKCYQSGANSYIYKPDNVEDFNELVIQLGNYWLSLNEPPC